MVAADPEWILLDLMSQSLTGQARTCQQGEKPSKSVCVQSFCSKQDFLAK